MKHDLIALFLLMACAVAASMTLQAQVTELRHEIEMLEARIEKLESPPCEWSRALESLPQKSKETK